MFVIIPSARSIRLDYIAPLIDAGATVVVVDDTGERTIKTPSAKVKVLYHEDRLELLGDLAACIPHRNGASRDFGLWYAYMHAHDDEIIVCVDDDCEVPASYYADAVASLGPRKLPMLQTAERFYNPIHLYTPDPHVYHRGFPYESRVEEHDYTYDQSATGNVVFNLGLWRGTFDVNGIDKLYLKKYSFPEANLSHSQVAIGKGIIAPLSSMNMIFRKEVIPAIYQLPMNEPIVPNWTIDRYGDIWGGFICKKLVDIKGDLLSVGNPMIVHHKHETPDGVLKNIRQEHGAHLVNLDFCAVLDAACESIKPSDYLTMYQEFASNLLAMSGKIPMPLRNYLEPTAKKMEMWVKALIGASRAAGKAS